MYSYFSYLNPSHHQKNTEHEKALFSYPYIPAISNLHQRIGAVLFTNNTQTLQALFGLYTGCFICIGIGLYSNLFAAVAWFLHGLLVNTSVVYGYGVETFIHLLLFYFIFMPLDSRYSMINLLQRPKDNGVKRRHHQQVIARITLRVLQLHLCMVYLNAGLSIMLVLEWRNGEALFQLLNSFPFRFVNAEWLVNHPFLFTIAGWMVIGLETTYCFLVWLRSTRRFMISCILLMHLCIGLLLGLHLFAAIMLLLNIGAFAFILNLTASQPTTGVTVCNLHQHSISPTAT